MTRRRTFVLVLAFWSFIALAFASSNWAGYAVKGEPISAIDAGYWAFSEWYLWGLLAPGVFYLSRRFPLTRDAWQRNLPKHVLGWLATMALWSMGYVTLERFGTPWATMPPTWASHVLLYLTKKPGFSLLVYATMAGAAHGLELYRAYRERERRAAELEAQLGRAQLDVLKSQLQPHFLFNTLHAITALIRPDPAAAESMVARLSDLLRMSLQTAGRQEVPLRQEIDFLGHYVEIQRTRFRDRLRVSVEIAPEAMDAMVPSLLLQPLVENAVKHGMEPRAAKVRVVVEARRDGDMLHLGVSDDGPGFNGHRDGGIGLANTRQRLEHLYGARQRLELGSCPGGGARVAITLPWKAADA